MICAQVLLGNTPIFWMVEYSYVSVILGVSLGTFFLWPRLSAKFGLTIDGEFVFWADTIGLAAAVVAGAAIGEDNHERVTVFASAIAGTATACVEINQCDAGKFDSHRRRAVLGEYSVTSSCRSPCGS